MTRETKARLDRVLGHMPYAAFLGVTGAIEETGEFLAMMPFKEANIGNPVLPAIHGGALGAFLEMAAAMRLGLERDDGKPPLTIGVTVEYLRPGRPKDTYARAYIKRLGRRIANVHVEAWQEAAHTPIALLQGRFLIPAED